MGKADRDNDRDSPGRGGSSSGSSGSTGGRKGKSPQDFGAKDDNDSGFASGPGAGFANDQQAKENDDNRAPGGIGGNGGGYLDARDDPAGGWGTERGIPAFSKNRHIKKEEEDEEGILDTIKDWFSETFTPVHNPDNYFDPYNTELKPFHPEIKDAIKDYSGANVITRAIKAFSSLAPVVGTVVGGVPGGLIGFGITKAADMYLNREQDEDESFASHQGRVDTARKDAGLVGDGLSRLGPTGGLGLLADDMARASLNPTRSVSTKPDRDMSNGSTASRSGSTVSAASQPQTPQDVAKIFSEMYQDEDKFLGIGSYDPRKLSFKPTRRS